MSRGGEQLTWAAMLELSSAQWIEYMTVGIRHVSRKRENFTTDDVWAFLEAWYDIPESLERRAMGAAIRQAREAGLIEHTGSYRKSARKENHARPVAVWKRVR